MSGFNPFESNNQIGVTIREIKNLPSIDEKVKAVRSCVNTLIYEALQRDKAELKIIKGNNHETFKAKFDYNGSIYYWTEKHRQAVPFKKFDQATIELYSKEGLLKNGITVLYYEWSRFKDVLPDSTYTLSYQTLEKENLIGFSSNTNHNRDFQFMAVKVNSGKMYWLEDDNGNRLSKHYYSLDRGLSIRALELDYGGLICAQGDNGYGFIDQNGYEVIECCYKQPVMSCTDGLYGLCRADNNKWGFVNNVGVIVIPFIYEDALPFSCKLAAVKKNGKWGYINKNGNIVIDFQYDDETCSFYDICGVERAIVRKNPRIGKAKFYYIDKDNHKTSRKFDDFQLEDPITGNRVILCGNKELIIDKYGNDIQ